MSGKGSGRRKENTALFTANYSNIKPTTKKCGCRKISIKWTDDGKFCKLCGEQL